MLQVLDSYKWLAGVGSLLIATGFTPAVSAHKVQVTEDIAGTWHVDPNHRPRAGETAQVWVALTRKGGKILPLEQATCKLDIYRSPRQPANSPILQPALSSIDIEQYQGIPGATVIFPTTGLYDLELNCAPRVSGDFQPFQLDYQVTVAEGKSLSASPPTASPASPAPEAVQSSQHLLGAVGGIALVILLGLLLRGLLSKR